MVALRLLSLKVDVGQAVSEQLGVALLLLTSISNKLQFYPVGQLILRKKKLIAMALIKQN